MLGEHGPTARGTFIKHSTKPFLQPDVPDITCYKRIQRQHELSDKERAGGNRQSKGMSANKQFDSTREGLAHMQDTFDTLYLAT